MFENPAVLALFIILWTLAGIAAVVVYLNHKAHKRDQDRKPGS
jgi:hypothetical protein